MTKKPPAVPPPRPISWYYPDLEAPQTPADVAVVIPTVLRPCLVRALDSIFAQEGAGRIQILVGIDKSLDSQGYLQEALARRPSNVSAILLSLPYSTSVRHGGVHLAMDGGSLRAVLAFMANARHVAFLDDDNAWEPDHLAGLLEAVKGKPWAYSLRLLIDEESGEELGVDRWDSVGVGRGRFKQEGGMVDPNCLIIDKLKTARALGRWSEGPGVESDRHFFDAIKHLPHGRVERATVRYGLRPKNLLYHFVRDGTEF